MFGLGKPRTKYKKWLDKEGLSQDEVHRYGKISPNTVTKLCRDQNYIPPQKVMEKALKFVRKFDPNAKMSDFWDM